MNFDLLPPNCQELRPSGHFEDVPLRQKILNSGAVRCCRNIDHRKSSISARLTSLNSSFLLQNESVVSEHQTDPKMKFMVAAGFCSI